MKALFLALLLWAPSALATQFIFDCQGQLSVSGTTATCVAGQPTTPPGNCSILGPITGTVGQNITLTSQCTSGGAATSWLWYGGMCGGKTTQSCTGHETFNVSVPYYVVPHNAAGDGPTSQTTVVWSGAAPPVQTCASQGIAVLGPQALNPNIGAYHSNDQGQFGNHAVWQFTLTLPATPTTQPGQIAMSQYGGNTYNRMLNISTVPCDMRWPADPNGINGPIAAGGGTTAQVYFTTIPGTGYPTLQPNVTYYVNGYNWDGTQWTCDRSNCQAVINWTNPRAAVAKAKAGKSKAK